jgi:hypothetical protein
MPIPKKKVPMIPPVRLPENNEKPITNEHTKSPSPNHYKVRDLKKKTKKSPRKLKEEEIGKEEFSEGERVEFELPKGDS